MTQREFENIFGRKLQKRSGDYLPYIMLSTILVAFFVVIFLANFTFNSHEIHQEIASRYQQLIIEKFRNESITEFIDQQPAEEKPDFYIPPVSKAGSGREKIAKDLTESVRINPYAGLPETDIGAMQIEELTGEDSGNKGTRFFKRSSQARADYAKDPGEDLMRDPYEYKIYRTANLYLEMPEYLVEEQQEKEEYGFRDQDEIMRVIYRKSSIIESCYQKALRSNTVSSGYVKVEFKIAPDGYVLPGSINIINSTIRNRLVEECIKKNIRRWRDFEKLNENKGIAHVVHKFVFN